MKTCLSCKMMKPLEDFHNRTKAKDGKQANCKDCNREQRKAYYKTAHGRDKNITTGKRWKTLMMKKVFDYLRERCCVDCGETDVRVLEFDHRSPEDKSFSIAFGLRNGLGWPKLLAEIEKCDVRCANCHRIRTAEQFGWAKLAWMTEDVVD